MHRLDLRLATGATRPIIGMVHLQPLPGAPSCTGMDDVLTAACRDATALDRGGVDAIMVENYGDAPFFPGSVPAETVAGLTRAVVEIRRVTDRPVGVNVLRNDVRSALAIATVTGARFVRVNVHTGAMLTDQGWIAGQAHETVRVRRQLDPTVAILADVMVKHAVPPAGLQIEDAARDTWQRGMADALVVTGAATGSPASTERLERVRTAVPEATLLVGSGLSTDNAARLMEWADGAIIGSAFQAGGVAGRAVELERVQRLVGALRDITG